MARGRRAACMLVLATTLGGAAGVQGEPLNVYVGQGQMPFADGVAKCRAVRRADA